MSTNQNHRPSCTTCLGGWGWAGRGPSSAEVSACAAAAAGACSWARASDTRAWSLLTRSSTITPGARYGSAVVASASAGSTSNLRLRPRLLHQLKKAVRRRPQSVVQQRPAVCARPCPTHLDECPVAGQLLHFSHCWWQRLAAQGARACGAQDPLAAACAVRMEAGEGAGPPASLLLVGVIAHWAIHLQQ